MCVISNLSTHLPLCLLIRKMKWEWVLKQRNNSDEGEMFLINIKQWTTIGHSSTQHDNHNRNFKNNSAMILTFVFVYRNTATVAINIKNYVIICTNDVVMLWCISRKKRQVYCEYEHNVRCDRTVLRFSLPSCLSIRKMKCQRRFKQCNNVAVKMRTSLSRIW